MGTLNASLENERSIELSKKDSNAQGANISILMEEKKVATLYLSYFGGGLGMFLTSMGRLPQVPLEVSLKNSDPQTPIYRLRLEEVKKELQITVQEEDENTVKLLLALVVLS